MPAKPRYDLGIIVALPEELEYILEVAPLVESVGRDGTQVDHPKAV
jgi:hypothetical protein